MAVVTRRPRPALRPFVLRVWASGAPQPTGAPSLERVLPTGGAHVVVRLSSPLTLCADDGGRGSRVVGHAVLGGPRSSAYVRAIEGPMASVGAELAPGAVAALFGVPARLLAERHTVLEDLWGGAVIELRERLRAEIDGSARLALFEAFLEARLPRVRGVHPAIAEAVARLAEGARVADVVTKSGASHRRFVDRFRDVVGLGPKSFARVARLQRAVGLLGRGNPLVDVAADAGYADQPHLCRDFAEIAGVSPAAYARACPEGGNHVPIRRSA